MQVWNPNVTEARNLPFNCCLDDPWREEEWMMALVARQGEAHSRFTAWEDEKEQSEERRGFCFTNPKFFPNETNYDKPFQTCAKRRALPVSALKPNDPTPPHVPLPRLGHVISLSPFSFAHELTFLPQFWSNSFIFFFINLVHPLTFFIYLSSITKIPYFFL